MAKSRKRLSRRQRKQTAKRTTKQAPRVSRLTKVREWIHRNGWNIINTTINICRFVFEYGLAIKAKALLFWAIAGPWILKAAIIIKGCAVALLALLL